MKVSKAIELLKEMYSEDDEVIIMWWGNDNLIDESIWSEVVYQVEETNDLDSYIGSISDHISDVVTELGGDGDESSGTH